MRHLAVLEDEAGFAYLLRSSDPWARVDALNRQGTMISVESTFANAGLYEGVLKTRLRDFQDDSFRGMHGTVRYLCTPGRIMQVASEMLPESFRTELPRRAASASCRGACAQLLRERAQELLRQAVLLELRSPNVEEGSTGSMPPEPADPPRLVRSPSETELWLQHVNWSAW